MLTLRALGMPVRACIVASMATAVVSNHRYSTSMDPPIANNEEHPRGFSLAREGKRATHEWNETLASRSEAIVKAERMPYKDIAELQRETAEQRNQQEVRSLHRKERHAAQVHDKRDTHDGKHQHGKDMPHTTEVTGGDSFQMLEKSSTTTIVRRVVVP
eukprot:Opistho-2@54945